MDENETQDVETEAEVEEEIPDDTEETSETEEETTEEDKGKTEKTEKPKETAQQRKARLTRQLAKVNKELGEKDEEVSSARKTKTGELDETVLDYLDLKGVSEPEDIKVVEGIMKKTGMSAREALKDEYVVSKLKANKDSREVKDAMPSNQKRGSGGGSNLAAAIAKFEKDGVLPDDFDLRSKIVDAVEAKTSNNAPSWHK